MFAGLFLLIAGIGWLSVRMAPRLGTPGIGAPGVVAASPARPGKAPAGKAPAGKAGPATDQASRMVAGLAKLLPYATVIIAGFLPLAAGLYLLTTTAWTLAERALLRRRLNARAG